MYNFFNCNYADITFSLASIDWNKLFKDLSINEAVDLFYSIIYDIIDIFVPKIIKCQSYYLPWYGKIAHTVFKSLGLVSDDNTFSNFRGRCKFLLSKLCK